MSEDKAVEIICTECGADVRVADPAELIRALHLLHECTISALFQGVQE